MGKKYKAKDILLNKLAFKIAITVSLCILLVEVLRIFDLDRSIYFVTIGGLVTIQTTKKDSLAMGIGRIAGTIVGGLVAVLTIYIFDDLLNGYGLFFVAFFSIYLIMIINGKIGNQAGFLESAVIFTTIIMLDHQETNILYVTNRLFDTIMGVGIGTLISIYVFPFKEEKNEGF